MAETRFCAWCLKTKNNLTSGKNYCINCKRFLCHGCAESHLRKDSSHHTLPAANVRFCDKCSHVNACAFCWECKLYFCDICSLKHTSAEDTSFHRLEMHEWITDDTPGHHGTSRTAVVGISGQDHLRNQTEQASASNDEADMDRLVYTDYTGPSNQADQRQQLYLASEDLPDDYHQYDYIDIRYYDIRIGKCDDKLLITRMHVLPKGDIVLYDKVEKQLMLYDAKMMKCQSSHQMQSAIIGMCTIRLGAEDRVYVVVQGNNSKSGEIIHFVIDNTPSQLQTKGSATLDYESSGLTGYDSGIAVIQNMRKGRILLHLYNKNYKEEKVLSFDFRISLTDKFGSRHGPEQRYSLSTVGRGKLVVISDCKYNFVAIVDVERGQQVLKYENASLTCPSQVATYQDNIVFILCRETDNIHVMEITGSADQRRELTSRDTINLKEWSPGAMCCSSSEGTLYVSHSQVATVRLYKLFDTIGQ